MNGIVKKPRLPHASDWTMELLGEYHQAIKAVAGEYGLDTYPNQLEIITSEQMMDAYASVGMPVNYRHWSFGKEFTKNENRYKRGQMGLAYEIVINSDPCISYLMEENTMAMQALVIAHAAYGHNSFFKGNYLFRQWTDASAIIDYLVYARDYIAKCEERYGMDTVEEFLDSCHALQNYGANRYRRPQKLSLAEERARQKEREAYRQSQVNDLWRVTAPDVDKGKGVGAERRFPAEPEENILYFIEKNAPLLETWQREIIRIVYKIAQYFYPQRQTQVMNEGWATFWHHAILHTMYDSGELDDGMMLEWMKSHTNVVYQPAVGDRGYGGINPYALGYEMYTDIRRIVEGGTWEGDTFVPSSGEVLAEDHEWFPDIAGKGKGLHAWSAEGARWVPFLDHAMRNFKDESFIGQYLSPYLMRKMRLFAVNDDDAEEDLIVSAMHREDGYRALREMLSRQYDLGERQPNIQVYRVNKRDRSLTLRHTVVNRRLLADNTAEMLKHVARLWGFTVCLESVDEDGDVVFEDQCVIKNSDN